MTCWDCQSLKKVDHKRLTYFKTIWYVETGTKIHKHGVWSLSIPDPING